MPWRSPEETRARRQGAWALRGKPSTPNSRNTVCPPEGWRSMNLWSWRKISLRVRIYTVLTTLVAITLVGGLVMVWYTYRMESLLADLVDKNLAAYQAAEALESALIQQRG